MRFDFLQEQQMLAESVRRTLEALPKTRVPAGGSFQDIEPSSQEAGRTLAGIGLFGLLVEESRGGLGLGMVEAAAVAIETGRAAVPFPAIECMVAMAVASRSRPDVVQSVLEGGAFATAPIHGRLTRGSGSRPNIEGTLSVPFADTATYLLAPLQGNGTAGGALLTEINGDVGIPTDGLDLSYPLNRIEFSRAVSENEIVAGRVDDMLGILAAAEMVGAAEHCLERTVAYLGERQQFGKVIGTFQALKHIAADCRVQLEAMKASVEYAAVQFDRAARDGTADDIEAETAFRAAKAYCSDAALKIAEQCIQLHGGIAFTWEYGLHIHFRRIARLANSHGRAYEHHEALATIAIEGAQRYGGLATN
jgi:alkylation response protein AidB-like acyl-CoA dehydrogenase